MQRDMQRQREAHARELRDQMWELERQTTTVHADLEHMGAHE